MSLLESNHQLDAWWSLASQKDVAAEQGGEISVHGNGKAASWCHLNSFIMPDSSRNLGYLNSFHKE